MSYQIALNFEDGVTRFIECKPNARRRRLLPAADQHPAGLSRRGLRHLQVLLRVGRLRARRLHRGRDDRRGGGRRLRPDLPDGAGSDLIMRIPATSDVSQGRVPTYAGAVTSSTPYPTPRSRFAIRLNDPTALGFLPGHYVNIQVPGSDQTRSYSFSSGPGGDEVGFLIRNTPHGVLTTYLRDRAKPGDRYRVQGSAGQLLPAGDKAAGAVPGRRHRAGPVPVDARQDQQGGGRSTRST